MSKERLIKKEAALNTVEFAYKACDGDIENFKELLIQCFEDLPEVEAEPVRHGEWLEREDDYDWYVFCSECGDEYVEDKDLRVASWVKQYFNYCPYCGAKMDKRKKNEID